MIPESGHTPIETKPKVPIPDRMTTGYRIGSQIDRISDTIGVLAVRPFTATSNLYIVPHLY